MAHSLIAKASVRGKLVGMGAFLVAATTLSAQVITGVAATNITSTSAVITWSTTLPASSLVNYGVTASYGSSTPLDSTQNTTHSVTLQGLTPNTLYNFDVVSLGSANTNVTSGNFLFATLSLSPIIANINVIYITSTSATVNWTTDQPSTSVVNYGPTPAYGSSAPPSLTPATAHSVTLNGLAAGSTYNFNVVSAGPANVASSSANQTFTTASVSATAPNLSFVASYSITNSSAILSWSTDVPANTVLAYGTSSSLGQLTAVQTALSTSHQVTLNGLNRGTTYYFIGVSQGTGGAIGYSPIYSLTTTEPPSLVPVISNIATSNLTTTSATITWTTDSPSTSQVNYGTTPSYGSSSTLDATLKTAHSVTLTGLTPGTVYDFQLVSVNTNGPSMFGANMTGLTVWGWGDSLTEGYGDLTQNTYPLYLSTQIGVPVANEGIGGATSTQIAQAMLATPASFTAGNCNVIWSGANNHNAVSTVLSDVASMVSALNSPRCFLVMGDINNDLSPAGTADYNSVISTNLSEASAYGNNYLNIRELLVQAYNPALPMDVASHANDLPAESFHAVQAHGTVTSGALDNVSCAISLSNGTEGVGTAIVIEQETILINALSGTLNVTACTRGYNGTAAASHAANVGYSIIDPIHLGSNGYDFVAQQVAQWFSSQFPLNFTTPTTNTPGPVITAVMASSINTTTAFITWTTDQPTTSLVNYGLSPSYGTASVLDPTFSTTHSVVLAGLAPNSVYNFDVVSANSAGRFSTSPNSAFTTSSAPSPVISNVLTSNLTPISVTITWTTSQPATAQVNYGTTTSYGTSSAATLTLATNQSVTLTGLTPNTTYDYQVISANGLDASSVSLNFSFTTPTASGPAPNVGYVAAWGINNTGAVVTWSTDVNASTALAYGTTPSLGQIYVDTSAGSASTLSHGVTLTGLTPGTTYYYVAQSTGADGATGYSPTYSFTTTGMAPVNPSFTLTATAAAATPASTAVSTITVSPVNGFNSAVTLTASGWPTGITASFGTNPATASSMVTISVGASVAPGTYALTVSGISGSLAANATLSLTVTASPSFLLNATAAMANAGSVGTSTVTVAPVNGFNSAVTLAASNWPVGITGSFGTNPETASSIITISVAANIVPGTYSLIVNGASGTLSASTTISLSVTATPNFSLSATAATANAGSSGTSTITITPLSGSNPVVTLVASGWPAGITGTFGTNPATDSSIVTIAVGANVASGVYSLAVNGTSGSLAASTTLSLTVSAAPNFTMSATAAMATVGSSGTSTLSLMPTNGFNSPVALAASGWPAGITGTFATNPATSSSIVTINVGPSVAGGLYTLTVNGTYGNLANVTTIALTVTPILSAGSSAAFTGTDTATQGSWSGKYGSDGLIIANGLSNLPSYANIGFTGALTYTWAGLSYDVRALQISPGSTDRIASSYYSNGGSFSISLSTNDGATHQVAIYLLDWDTTTRMETVSITDSASGTLLDSRSFTGFHNGVYGLWNIKGSVNITIAASVGNPVASAIFFGPPTAGGPSPSFTLSGTTATASAGSPGISSVTISPANGFNSAVTLATSGWPTGITGTFGTNPATTSSIATVSVDNSVAPGSYTLTVTGVSGALSANATIPLTVNPAAQSSFGLSATAATVNAGSTGTSTVTLTPMNGFTSAVTLATSGWPAGITATFGTNPTNGLSIVTISVAANVAVGTYPLSVVGTSGTLSANTTIALTVSAGSGNRATFIGLDTTTQGAWTGKYGSDGQLIANTANVSPAYATVGFSHILAYTWAGQTSDVRALQSSAGASTGIASAYTETNNLAFTMSVGITDGRAHKISLYLLDWDSSSRVETITILDAVTNAVLDTETFSGFHNGEYASWNVSGNVSIVVTPAGYYSPVVSGIFFN